MALKILMATMGLGIGGAETHIVELSGELKRRGHDVIVASTAASTCLKLRKGPPLYRPDAQAQCFLYDPPYFLLRGHQAEKPDVVHAHARYLPSSAQY